MTAHKTHTTASLADDRVIDSAGRIEDYRRCPADEAEYWTTPAQTLTLPEKTIPKSLPPQ